MPVLLPSLLVVKCVIFKEITHFLE